MPEKKVKIVQHLVFKPVSHMFLREKVVSRVEKNVVLRVGEPGGALGRLDLAHLGCGGLDNADKRSTTYVHGLLKPI